MTLNTRTLVATLLGLELALLAGGCSQSDPVETSTVPDPVESSAWYENVAPGAVVIRDVETDEPGVTACEFGVGSPCSISFGISSAQGLGGVGTKLGVTAPGQSVVPESSSYFTRHHTLRFETEQVDGSSLLNDLVYLLGKETADVLREAHPDLADSTLLRCTTEVGGARSRGVVPGSVRKPSDKARSWQSSGRVGPNTRKVGEMIYLASNFTFESRGPGNIKEVDGRTCLTLTDDQGVNVDVPLSEYELPGWVLWVKFEPLE